MSRSHYFYFKNPVKDLEALTTAHQTHFDEVVGDLFSDQDLENFEKYLDSIAAVYVQPILSELHFSDFYPDPKQAELQRSFFESCRSSVCLENLPYFESNPFQVSYLEMWLTAFEEVLIDRGGTFELVFKNTYLDELKKYRNMDSLISSHAFKPKEAKSNKSISPVDFLVIDIYKELDRLSRSETIVVPSEKANKLFHIMRSEDLSAEEIFKKSGLIPKDFEDSLERLKFTLKKL